MVKKDKTKVNVLFSGQMQWHLFNSNTSKIHRISYMNCPTNHICTKQNICPTKDYIILITKKNF